MAKRRKLIMGIALLIFAASGIVASWQREKISGDHPPPATMPRYAVYFIRARVDCASCIKMKAWTREVIGRTAKADQLSGQLVTHTIYYDNPLPQDAALVKTFGIYTQSIVLAEEDASGILRSQNLTRVWELLRDRAAFTQYIESELTEFQHRKTPTVAPTLPPPPEDQ